MCRLQQSFAAGSPVIFGLDFDEGGREQGCRNLGSLTVPARYSKKEYIIYQDKRNYFNSTSYSFLLNLSLNLSVLVFIVPPYLLVSECLWRMDLIYVGRF